MSKIGLVRLIIDQLLYWEVDPELMTNLTEQLVGKEEAIRLLRDRQPSNRLEEFIQLRKTSSVSTGSPLFESTDFFHDDGEEFSKDQRMLVSSYPDSVPFDHLDTEFEKEEVEVGEEEKSPKDIEQHNDVISTEIRGIDNLEEEKERKEILYEFTFYEKYIGGIE
jgi:hypothetical protein